MHFSTKRTIIEFEVLLKEKKKMDMLKKYFPNAFGATDVKPLVVALLIYAVVACVGGFVLGLLGIIPVIGYIARVVGWVLDVYCAVGIILAILVFLKVIK